MTKRDRLKAFLLALATFLYGCRDPSEYCAEKCGSTGVKSFRVAERGWSEEARITCTCFGSKSK